MWNESFHRFASEAAFLAARDAAGWPRGPDGKPLSPEGVALDVVGPAMDPPAFAGTLITQGAIDTRWHVNVSWFSGTAMPPSFAAAEVIPGRPIRMATATDRATKAVAIRAAFEARRLAKPDDPKLVSTVSEAATEKLD